MDVRDLAPALLAIGDVVTEANRVLNEDRTAVKLYRHKKTRQGIKEIIKPLLKNGIDKFIVREREKKVIEIAESEEPYFDVPEIPDEEITDSTRRVACNIIGVFFEEGLKWRLYDGENKLNALIKDSGFLAALDKGEVSFSKGDMLIVKLRTRQWQTEKGLKQEHEVVKVIKQQKAKEQIPLPFRSEDVPSSDT